MGLLVAGGMRLVLLLAVGWIITLKKELFTIGDLGFSGKELILLAGGLFLIFKATKEIHHKLEGEADHESTRTAPTFTAVITQVLILDIVFSIDSVITAVGMTTYVPVMVIAIVAAVGVMLVGEDVGTRLPASDRHGAGGGWPWLSHPQGLHLCGHGLLGRGRVPQPGRASQARSVMEQGARFSVAVA